ncbi:MAG TPA: type IV toxin-antitoxin system AbiEi family antitoxin domain-containing protein [Solirubrobacteraceae bacterium]|nr:type IV toxin-antitoxin system AbiEi family antitoxin domain-containing protein [Solirubrobacteraceae bacterium]
MRAIAERQWGTIGYAQLIAIGFTPDEIAGMVARGQLIRIYHGVYALGHCRLTLDGRLHAAQLVAGPRAFLSHRIAAARRGLRQYPSVIELTVPAEHTPHRRPGLRLHRTTIPIDHRAARMHNGLLTATVPRIIIDLARTERPGEIQRLIRESIRTGQFDRAALQQAIDAHPHRPGVGLARAALQRYLPGSEDRRSSLEADFQEHARGDPRLLRPLYNQRLLGYEIDVVWIEQRVTLELDGRPYHVAVDDFDRDRAKDRALSGHGWRPVRVSDFEWEHARASVLDDLYRLLGT